MDINNVSDIRISGAVTSQNRVLRNTYMPFCRHHHGIIANFNGRTEGERLANYLHGPYIICNAKSFLR